MLNAIWVTEALASSGDVGRVAQARAEPPVAPRSGGVPLWLLHVDAAGRGLPPVPSRLRLGDVPAG
jgi:hypothetical protein